MSDNYVQHQHEVVLLLGKGLLYISQVTGYNVYTNGGADPTFASAKVKNAFGRIGIFK